MLTKEGFENREAFVDAVFKYFALIRSSELASYHYEEQRQMGEIHFRFAEKANADDYAIMIAGNMNKPYAREHVLSGRQRVWDWDESEVRGLLEEMVPEKARVMFCTKDAKEFGERNRKRRKKKQEDEDGEWEKETWYGTEYRVRRLPEALLKDVSRSLIWNIGN